MHNSTIAPLISFIVPMYNVEKYIAKCIESIITQTYTNIEIILINDGSPDNSGKIADNFSRIDSRITVIHTTNNDVSEARNLGINKAKGDYIVFVDSDDYLSSDFAEYMLEIAKKTNAEFVMSKNCFKIPRTDYQINQDAIKTYSPDEAAALLLYPGYVEIGCWNKMFLKDFLIQNNIFFLKKFYIKEGLNFIVSAAQKSKIIGIGNKKVYYYRKNNPHSATTELSVQKYINALAAIDNIEKTSIIKTSKFKTALKLHKYITTFVALSIILQTNSKNEFKKEYSEYMNLIRKDILFMLQSKFAIKLKIKMLMYSLHPKLAFRFLKIFKKLKTHSKL